MFELIYKWAKNVILLQIIFILYVLPFVVVGLVIKYLALQIGLNLEGDNFILLFVVSIGLSYPIYSYLSKTFIGKFVGNLSDYLD